MLDNNPVFKQFLVIGCCNLLTLSFGFISGWPTIYYNDLNSQNSTYSAGQLTKDQLNLIISFDKFGGLIGNFAILPLMKFVGVKRTIHSLGFALIISSLLIIFGKNVFLLCLSRILSGFTGGALVVGIPSLAIDISFDNVRGALNSIYDPSNNFGLIMSFFLGNYLSCTDQAKVQLVAPVLFIIAMFIFPESPEFLASKNQAKKAIKSRQFYKGNIVAQSSNSQNDQLEHGKSKNIDNEYEPELEPESNSKLKFSDFLTPHAKRAFFISFTPLALSFISGSSVILNFVTRIFAKTGSMLSDKDSSLLISIIQIIANIVMLNIIERFNRRTLYIWSSILTTASYILFGIYCWFWIKIPAFEWIPPFCFACIVFFSCMGLLPIPYIITTEVFPKKIRQICLSLALSCMYVISFILDMVLPQFFETPTLLSVGMFTLGFVCLINAAFGYYCIIETRGKSFKEISELLSR